MSPFSSLFLPPFPVPGQRAGGPGKTREDTSPKAANQNARSLALPSSERSLDSNPSRDRHEGVTSGVSRRWEVRNMSVSKRWALAGRDPAHCLLFAEPVYPGEEPHCFVG